MAKRFTVKNLRWVLLCFFVLVMLLNYIGRSSLSIALSLVSSDLHMNESTAGILSSSFFWSYTLMQIPGGWLVNHLKTRKIVTTTLLGWGVIQALTAVATSFNIFIWFRLLLGIFEGPVQVGMNNATLKWLRADERGRGSTIIDSGGPLGSAIGSLFVTGLIVWLGSWRTAFVFIGAVTVLVGVLAWLFIRNEPSDHPWITDDEAQYLDQGIKAEEQNEQQESSAAPELRAAAFRSLSPWMLVVGFAAYDAVQYGLLTWAPYYISQSRGVGFGMTGIASMIVYLGGFLGEMVVGQVADRWRRAGGSNNLVMRTLFVFAGVGVTVCTLLVNAVTGVVAAIMLLTIASFFVRFGGLYWSVPQMIVRREQVAVVSSVMNFGGNAMGIAIPILVGVIAQATGSFTGVFIMFSACGLAMALASAIMNYSRKSAKVGQVA